MQPVGFLVDQYGNPLSGYGQPPSPVGGAGLDREGGEDEPWMPNAPQGSLLRHGMKGSFNRSGSDRSLRSNQSEDADSCRSRASSFARFLARFSASVFFRACARLCCLDWFTIL